jgi:SM-20-related protein
MHARLQPLPVSNDPLRLNPLLNRAQLAEQFRLRGRIHIGDVLTTASADRVHHCLQNETRYVLCTNIGGTVRALRDLTASERQAYTITAWQEVGIKGFQFLYETHRISLAGEPYADSQHYLSRVFAFLNGPEFLGFARDITGIGEIEFTDAQATVYRNGHFLTAHDDDVAGSKRVVAYVFGFTPVWRPEWGGLLEFVNSSGEAEAGYLPGFNSLKLFHVPMSYCVSVVAPYALAPRHSITGWLRAR